MCSYRRGRTLCVIGLVAFAAAPFPTSAGTVRIVTYNIDCSDQVIVQPNPGYDTLLQAIGNHHLAGHAQPIDVLALQELDGTQNPGGTSATLPFVANALNAIYGAGAYAYDPTPDPNSGNLTGNGPSGIVYNTHTIQVISATPIGAPPSGSGAPRQPMRYLLRPIGSEGPSDFYLYVSHYKAGGNASDISRRNIEAQEIRADADTLGAGVHIIYAGDFNLTGGSSEAMYQTLVAAGNGQAHDPAIAGAFSNTAQFVAIESESATSLRSRFDFELVSGAVLNQPGFQLVTGSYTVFGNNGTTPYSGSVDSPNNTSLSDLGNAAQVLSLLTTVSDHLPVVADYSVNTGTCVSGPSFTTQPTPLTGCSGQPATLTAAADGSPAPNFQWRKNSINIFGATGASYTIPSVGTGDAGSYDCVATNACSSITSNAVALTVIVSPSVADTSPPTATVKIGKVVSLTASGSGAAPLTFRWRRNTVNLADGGDYAGAATTTLTITPTSRADAGSFDVTSTNSCGTAISASSTTLTVLCRADFNNSGAVTVQDVFDFLAAWFGRGPDGDWNGDFAVTPQDVFDFLTVFFAPCT